MAKNGGKQAARFVINSHPDLFENNLIDMFPKIKALTPKLTITSKNASVKLLQSLIEACNVSDALTTYDFLVKKNVELSSDLKQSYLEMLCFHNGAEEELPENYFEYLNININEQVPKWQKGGAAEHLASEIMTEHGSQSPEAQKARLALMLGKSKFNDFHGVLALFDEMIANGGTLDVEAYNAVLKAKGNETDNFNDIKQILERMNAEKVMPNRQTMFEVLNTLNLLSRQSDCSAFALATLAEFKKLGIEPSLSCYTALIEIFKNTKDSLIVIDVVKRLEEIQKFKGTLLHEVVSESCLNFFNTAMNLAWKLSNISLAHNIHNLLVTDPNADVLLGGLAKEQYYFTNYLITVLRNEPLETTHDMLNMFVPHSFTPATKFYMEYLDEIERHGMPQYLPKVSLSFTLWELRKHILKITGDFTATILSQKFRQINFLLRKHTPN